jgi:hypothetical protein
MVDHKLVCISVWEASRHGFFVAIDQGAATKFFGAAAPFLLEETLIIP